MDRYICSTCGTMYAPQERPPASCPVCEDERQYVPRTGQVFLTMEQLSRSHRNAFEVLEDGLMGIQTVPDFAIGQRAVLVRTEEGSLLWDPLSLADAASVEIVRALGGVRAIASSHPHFFASMPVWAEEFDARIVLHAENRPYVMGESGRIDFVADDEVTLFGGLRLVRLGGHYPGSSVLEVPFAAEGRGALLVGDTLQVTPDPGWLSFMYSYPNSIPLPASTVEDVARRALSLRFERIYGAWLSIPSGGRESLERSARRYAAHLRA